jgi:hypothetical protein
VRKTMFRAWMDFAFASARLCSEAQEVVNLRPHKIARGGVDGHTEAQRMIAEKGLRSRRLLHDVRFGSLADIEG